MCMKNVNISTVFFNDELSELGGHTQFGKVLDEITTVKDYNGDDVIDNLTIVSFVCALSSDEDKNLEKKYELLWQFGTVVEDKFQPKSISRNILDTNVNKVEQILKITCKSFTNQIFKFTLRNYKIDQAGPHYLKVYIRDEGEQGEWQIQSMSRIIVNKS